MDEFEIEQRNDGWYFEGEWVCIRSISAGKARDCADYEIRYHDNHSLAMRLDMIANEIDRRKGRG